MKTRLVLLSLLAILVLIVAYIWRRSEPPQLDTVLQATTNSPESNTLSHLQQKQRVGPMVRTNDGEAEYLRWFLEEVRRDPTYEWTRPVNFYGKITDENDRPVEGATAECSWTDVSRAGTSQLTVTTDADGLFSLTNKKGKHLTVTINKGGYYQVPGQFFRAFEYAAPYERFHPDSTNPVIFRLHRMGNFVPLHRGIARIDLENNGREIVLDWLNDKFSQQGYFRAQIQIEPESTVDRRFSWRFRMSIPDGGFVSIGKEELSLMAPEAGYEEAVEIAQDVNNPDSPKTWPTEYYVVFGEPKRYGRIKIDLMPQRIEVYKTSILRVWYWINPSGSRNLEGNPEEGMPRIRLGEWHDGEIYPTAPRDRQIQYDNGKQ